jgi:hypothetical protein
MNWQRRIGSFGRWEMEDRRQTLDFGIWILEFGIWSLGFELWDFEFAKM